MKDLLLQKTIYFANACEDNLLGIIPPWHKNIDKANPDPAPGEELDCTLAAFQLNDIWVIVLNIIEILLRLGGLAAVGFIIWGGVQFVTSQGEPERVGKARDTIMNAVIGLILIIFANVIISFVMTSVLGAGT